MAEEAPKRSIDEIIGSIRSIMDRGDTVANDDVPVDLTDLPSGHAYAEPVAPRVVGDRFGDDITVPLDAADAERMAQIAETVNRNLDAAPIAPAASAPEPAPSASADATPDVSDEAIVASFGRRGAPARPSAPRRVAVQSDRSVDDLPMHDRFVAIGEVVEEAVTARGVVRAANDAAPGPVAPATAPASAPAPVVAPQPAAMLPATVPAMQAHGAQQGGAQATDPLLDDATLRPIIREWLDDNLPPLVERLVREELQKAIHGGRRGR